jgi:hypothetical protein
MFLEVVKGNFEGKAETNILELNSENFEATVQSFPFYLYSSMLLGVPIAGNSFQNMKKSLKPLKKNILILELLRSMLICISTLVLNSILKNTLN